MPHLIFSIVPADGLAQLGARSSVGRGMIEFISNVYTGTALQVLSILLL